MVSSYFTVITCPVPCQKQDRLSLLSTHQDLEKAAEVTIPAPMSISRPPVTGQDPFPHVLVLDAALLSHSTSQAFPP